MPSSPSPPASGIIPLLLLVVIACAAPGVRCSDDRRFPHFDRLRELHRRESSPSAEQEAAARGLLERLLPSHSASFEFRAISTEQCGGKACFVIDNHPLFDGEGTPEILILGVSGVEISAGFHWYLKHYCAAHISWYKTGGAQLSSIPHPGSLPRVPAGGILIRRPVDWSYHQNAVTSSCKFEDLLIWSMLILAEALWMAKWTPNVASGPSSSFQNFLGTSAEGLCFLTAAVVAEGHAPPMPTCPKPARRALVNLDKNRPVVTT